MTGSYMGWGSGVKGLHLNAGEDPAPLQAYQHNVRCVLECRPRPLHELPHLAIPTRPTIHNHTGRPKEGTAKVRKGPDNRVMASRRGEEAMHTLDVVARPEGRQRGIRYTGLTVSAHSREGGDGATRHEQSPG